MEGTMVCTCSHAFFSLYYLSSYTVNFTLQIAEWFYTNSNISEFWDSTTTVINMAVSALIRLCIWGPCPKGEGAYIVCALLWRSPLQNSFDIGVHIYTCMRGCIIWSFFVCLRLFRSTNLTKTMNCHPHTREISMVTVERRGTDSF